MGVPITHLMLLSLQKNDKVAIDFCSSVLTMLRQAKGGALKKHAATHPVSLASPMNSFVVKRGYVSVKEEGLRSFLWPKKWLILREQTLSFHKNEVRWFD
jgi:hypothetical protein